MRHAIALVLGLILGLYAPDAFAQQAESDVTAFRRLRAEGLAAAQVDDLTTAAALLAEADGLIPNHPGLMILRARLAVAMGDPREALVHYGRYADAGLILNLSRDEAFADLSARPDHAEAVSQIINQIETNRTPVGSEAISTLFQIEGASIVESVIGDEAHDRWLVSQIAGRTIVALAPDGTISPFLRPHPEVSGVLGMALDARRGILWATTTPLPPAIYGEEHNPRFAATLLEIDAGTGEVMWVYDPPLNGNDRAFGDLVLAPDGSVFVADSNSGDIFRLDSPRSELTLFVSGVFGSPQGMVVIGDRLIVADYSSGLWQVPLTGGSPARIPAPSHASLIGIDGLMTDGDSLYAIQNGVAPQRVLRLTLSADGRAIDTVTVLAANLPELDEPTTGLVLNGELVFVSRSQWSDFGPDGALVAPDPAPARIARLQLDHGDD